MDQTIEGWQELILTSAPFCSIMSGSACEARLSLAFNDFCSREAGTGPPPVGRPHDGLDRMKYA